MKIIVKATEKARTAVKEFFENAASIDLSHGKSSTRDHAIPMSVTAQADDSYELSVPDKKNISPGRFALAIVRMLQSKDLTMLKTECRKPNQVLTFGTRDEKSDRLVLG